MTQSTFLNKLILCQTSMFRN